MKILLIGSGVPFREHGEVGVTAVNIVFYQLICGLLGLGYEVALQLIFNEHRATTELTASEEAELRHMADLGVILLPPIYRDEYRQAGSPRSRLAKLGRLASWCLGASDLDDFYPAVVLGDTIEDRVRSLGAKAILTIWSPEGVAAAHGVRDVPRIAYHGDIDFGPAAARIRDRSLFVNGDREGSRVTSRVLLDAARQRLFLARFKRAHLHLMKGVDVIANVTACNADFYTATGHPRSVYIGNVWSDPGFQAVDAEGCTLSIGSSGRAIKIIGHVGKLGQTGSTYGLRFLLIDVLPALERMMDGLDYEIHIIGGGEVVSTLKHALRHPRVLPRGFVKDLDGELLSSDAFLLLNNAGSYQAAYTRHMMAWSQGLCLIVHDNSRRAIPEIRHMENALVGSTPEEIAGLIRLAATNSEVNLRVRKGGRATYERYFTPGVVAKALAAEIGWAVPRRAEGRS